MIWHRHKISPGDNKQIQCTVMAVNLDPQEKNAKIHQSGLIDQVIYSTCTVNN